MEFPAELPNNRYQRPSSCSFDTAGQHCPVLWPRVDHLFSQFEHPALHLFVPDESVVWLPRVGVPVHPVNLGCVGGPLAPTATTPTPGGVQTHLCSRKCALRLQGNDACATQGLATVSAVRVVCLALGWLPSKAHWD